MKLDLFVWVTFLANFRVALRRIILSDLWPHLTSTEALFWASALSKRSYSSLDKLFCLPLTEHYARTTWYSRKDKSSARYKYSKKTKFQRLKGKICIHYPFTDLLFDNRDQEQCFCRVFLAKIYLCCMQKNFLTGKVGKQPSKKGNKKVKNDTRLTSKQR